MARHARRLPTVNRAPAIRTLLTVAKLRLVHGTKRAPQLGHSGAAPDTAPASAPSRSTQSQSRQAHSTCPSPTPNRAAVYFSKSIRFPEGFAFWVQHPLQSESAHMS